jgi:hypothetical protein
MLLAAIGAASCASAPQSQAGGPPGYLAASRSSVAFLRLPARQASVTGSLELHVIAGTAPHRGVWQRSFPFSGRLHGRALTVRIDGRTVRGRLSGQVLTLGPLPGGAGTKTFAIAGASGYRRAVAGLRDQAARANTLARHAAARAVQHRQQARRAAGRLLAAEISVRQARRVVSRELAAMTTVARLAGRALARTDRDTRATLARTRQGARRVTVCGYAVMVDSDAVAVSAYRSGMAADAGSLARYLAALRAAIRALSAQLRTVQRGQPGYTGGGGYPSPAQVRHKLSSARQRTGTVLAAANGHISLVNRYVADAYRRSARASRARHCRSASARPAPLPPVGLTRLRPTRRCRSA